ncbi:hypothetical protein M407DRAFT_22976 [Tulasnella calospora MUT 4182]|uniref:Uncharacterized protein n=1 Tax=Tulasnella calospora MUT 4182 TaxID=1051891 RepID=A0A0C3QKD7_9AGAM|nr:hypothetical protein M407DRAFT_22976 [Tulasnella calospora MUT 4182]
MNSPQVSSIALDCTLRKHFPRDLPYKTRNLPPRSPDFPNQPSSSSLPSTIAMSSTKDVDNFVMRENPATSLDLPTFNQYYLSVSPLESRSPPATFSADRSSSPASDTRRPSNCLSYDSEISGRGLLDDTASSGLLRTSTSTRRLGLIGTVPTFFVLLISFGFPTLIVAWTLKHQDDDPESGGRGIAAAIRNGSFVLNEGKRSTRFDQHVSLRVLMFSALASHLISVTSALLMTVVAYRAAAQWLSSSETCTLSNPTPLQYGLLCRTLGSSNIMSFLKSLQYVLRGSSRRASLPPMFKEALRAATVIYIFTHTVGVVDIWLHGTTFSTAAMRPGPFTEPAAFGVDFNSTLCPNPHSKKAKLPCLCSRDGWAFNNTDVIRTGYSTSFNQSDSAFHVITLANERDTAIVIPGYNSNYREKTFIANTFAARAQCKSINNLCDRVPEGTGTYTGNCSNIGYPTIPYILPDDQGIADYVFGFVNGSMAGQAEGIPDFPKGKWLTPNPTSLVLQLRWSLHLNPDLVINQGESAVDLFPTPWVTLYATCELAYYNATVKYHPVSDSWELLNSTLSSPDLTSIIWAPLIYQHATTQITGSVIGIAMNSNSQEGVMAALNQNLGRNALSQVAGAFQPVPALEVYLMHPVVLGLYPAAPLLFLIGLLYLYSALTLSFFVASCTANYRSIVIPPEMTGKEKERERSALDLVQTYLTDPVPIVSESFPALDGKDPQRSVADDALDMVYDGGGSRERLRIGLLAGQARFGLWRRTGRESFAL